MVKLGYLLITAGFIAGSYFAVTDQATVDWIPWCLAVFAGIVGVAMARLGSHQSASSEDRLTADLAAIEESLDRLTEKAKILDGEKEEINPYDVRLRIDAEFMEDVNNFVEARNSLRHRFGVQAFAEIMTAFATAERSLNRAWSASTDGYVEAVHRSLTRAATHFQDAREKFQALS